MIVIKMASKVLRIILIVVLFIIFFEVGLVSSYTIVTSEAPNVQGLIDMQISKITGMFTPEKVNDMLIKDPSPVNITNTNNNTIGVLSPVSTSLDDVAEGASFITIILSVSAVNVPSADLIYIVPSLSSLNIIL